MYEEVFTLIEKHLQQVMAASLKHRDHAQNQTKSYQPYFSSILIRDDTDFAIDMSNGAVIQREEDNRIRRGRFETRFGDYTRGGGRAKSAFTLPYELDLRASKKILENSTTETMWAALRDFSRKNIQNIGSRTTDNRFKKFLKEQSHLFIDAEKKITNNLEELVEDLKEVSIKTEHKDIYSTDFYMGIEKINKYIVNSEGSKIFMSSIRNRLELTVSTTDVKGRLILNSQVLHWFDNSPRPTKEIIYQEMSTLIKDILEIAKAPFMKPGHYPCILDGLNHGVFWHEVIGHGLEGQRIGDTSEESESIFAKRIGTKVCPEFISLYDDPTLEGQAGSYLYDDEGIPAQKVTLIENGVLRNYLYSRENQSIIPTRSNGHGRCDLEYLPRARMSNLILKSEKQLSPEILEEQLIQLLREEHFDFGLIVLGTEGGYTIPEDSTFTTYPSKTYKIDKNGNKTLVRGLTIVGTPFTSLDSIIATGKNHLWFSGDCGAESGNVPSAQYAPEVLLRSLEFGKISKDTYSEVSQPIFK